MDIPVWAMYSRRNLTLWSIQSTPRVFLSAENSEAANLLESAGIPNCLGSKVSKKKHKASSELGKIRGFPPWNPWRRRRTKGGPGFPFSWLSPRCFYSWPNRRFQRFPVGPESIHCQMVWVQIEGWESQCGQCLSHRVGQIRHFFGG